MERDAPLSAAILAGGRSRRMGRDKAQLQLGDSTLVGRVLAAVQPLGCPCLLIADDPRPLAHLELPVHADLRPRSGPLGGLHTALSVAPSSTVLLLACDLPFVTTDFLRLLVSRLGSHEALVPRSDAGLEPLCAVYTRACLPAIEAALDRGERFMAAFHDEADVGFLEFDEWRHCDPDGLLLANLNTPEDYERAAARLDPRRRG